MLIESKQNRAQGFLMLSKKVNMDYRRGMLSSLSKFLQIQCNFLEYVIGNHIISRDLSPNIFAIVKIHDRF